MRFVVLGAGGVGGYFGAKLFAAGEDVWFVARGNHLEAAKSRGLTVRSPKEQLHVSPDRFTGDITDAGKADVVLFCVKSYDTENAAHRMIPALAADTSVICLQNGVDNEEKIQRIIPTGKVAGGVAYIYSTVTAPGEITRAEGPAKIVFGPLDNKVDERLHLIHNTLLRAGINADLSASMESELWKKFIFITGVSGITALTRLSLGELLAHGETRALIRGAMEETLAVARAKHVPLESGLIDSFFETLGKFKNDTRSSLYFDLANGKPMEVDALAGTVLRLGKQLG
ncbi:MAG TPA: 2-dehydropantoate 2-reductase, partial [Bacteroidota bacterium]|nr:2-dehydropantoate 2-reductase [Bacteroidota bacterium]